MSDEQLARSLLAEGLLTRDEVVAAAKQRTPGERLARVLLRLGAVPPGEILRIAPNALEDTPISAPPPVASPAAMPAPPQVRQQVAEVEPEAPERPQPSGDFWIEGGQEENAFDPMQAPIVHWSNYLLKTAITMGASDLHLEPTNEGILPRFRVDGRLRPGNPLPSEMSDAVISRIKIVANLDITETRMPQDGRFRAHFGDFTFDFRVSSLPSLHGEKLVLRVLDHSSLVTDLSQLGLSNETQERFDEVLGRSHGLMLVTGPTGSGKTTTLYAALAATRDHSRNVVTVEDPIEYEMPGVTQTAIHTEIGLSFATTLRAILRQDPDVILVGEIRDEETADIAVRAALTGHLVLATLHTNSAPGAITRLIDMGVPSYLLSGALAGVIAQRLVRRNCRSCREPIPQDDPAREEWAEFFGWSPDVPLQRGRGCQNCTDGSRGRVAVTEILIFDAELRRAVAAGREAGELRHIARENGFASLRDDARNKCLSGQLDPEQALRALSGHDE